MAYADYKTATTLAGNIVPDMTEPSGEPTGTAWIKNGESAEETKLNRAHQALAVNIDTLKTPLDTPIAVTTVEDLAAFAGNSFTIDTSGVVGDISMTQLASGTGDDITAGTPCTLDDLGATFTPDLVGKAIIISGAADANDDGTFPITAVNSGTQLEYTNGSAVGEIAGAFTYTISNGVYVGHSGYANNQEDRDTLFQFLDDSYNEVMVDGAEVKVSGISGTIGTDFHRADDGVLTVTLTDTVPSGDYKFKFGIPSSVSTLPNDALIKADIRGAQEVSGEAAKPACIVCAIDKTWGPADYVGAASVETAINAAISAGNPHAPIYVRPGTYTFSSALNITVDHLTIIGHSNEITSNTTILDFSGGAHDLSINGSWTTFKNLALKFTAGNGIRWQETRGRLDTVAIMDGELDLETGTSQMVIENTIINATGSSVALTLDGADNVTISNCAVWAVDQNALHVKSASTNIHVETTEFSNDDATNFNMAETLSYSTFDNCEFIAGDAMALWLDDTKADSIEFRACYFENVPGIASSDGIIDSHDPAVSSFQQIAFRDCQFTNENGSTRFQNPGLRLISISATGERVGILLENCYYRDDYCACIDGLGAGVVAADLRGVNIRNVVMDWSNQASMYEDGPLARFTDCYGEKILLLCPTTITNDSVYSDGVLEVLRGSEIRDMRIYGGNDEFHRAMVHIEGDEHSTTTGTGSAARFAIVDGLEIFNESLGPWTNVSSVSAPETAPLVARLLDQAILRRFVWDHNNEAGLEGSSPVQPNCLIGIEGNNAEVSGCLIAHPGTAATNRWLRHLIYGSDCSYARIFNNRFRVGDGRDHTALMRSAIRFVETSAQYGIEVRDNVLCWADDAYQKICGVGDQITAGAPCTLNDAEGGFTSDLVGLDIVISGCSNGGNNGPFPITAVNSVTELEYTNGAGVNETSPFDYYIASEEFALITFGDDVRACRVVNNYVEADDMSAPSLYIYFGEGSWPPAGGQPCGGSIVQGNTLINNDSSSSNRQPDIEDSGSSNPIGYTDNLRGAL